ncbi:2-oxoglutarate-dependent dioxygenase 11 isoform X2 [Ricinus communis]|uniref:2-oxoglutarate-dependent dioxygenase 11 isoform X2 n=1 Tax=Ricinus communis TaxID=3988 RepID=UPI000772B5BA|nr:2-oxoglutarate-dependent dioxygenase 11 isoform X2 [Ricinus communis]|eukprot:XP_015581845.1 protein SRG1 isoform X2 [Ricinus communis]
MANNPPTAKKTESVAKHVKEIAVNGQEPPRNYCYRDGVGGGLDICCLPPVEIPVIDVGLLASPSTSRQELKKLHSALSSFGCFMSINHGMTSPFLDKVGSVSKQFFALPIEEKEKYAKEVHRREGYGNDMTFAENQVLDWNDRLVLVLIPEDQRQLRYWPKNPTNFMAMAMSLDLEDHCFLDKCGVRATMQARFNFFPPCSRHDLVLGLKPHSDSSAITIVLQDQEVEGLQLLKDDQWFRVPVIPGALLINIGDQIEIMSNGFFKSPVHRAVINPTRERFSVAVFYSPDPENDIEPVDGLVNEARPRLYKKVKNYVGNFLQYYQQGKRLVEDMKI